MSTNAPHDDTEPLGAGTDPREIARRFSERNRPGEKPPEHIGPYRILETIGEGGMGVVYLAEQTRHIRRRVALKIIKLGLDTKDVIARFETEREALALMNHPNVARVFDAGATETGRPYFAMEHVAGIPITSYCDRHRLTTAERLRLFIDVCQAIQHAHQKGIIHRDIKPSNILVTVHDDRPVPKVIDFGVAKATQRRLTDRTIVTEQGQLIGTPGYVSPEQAEMTALDIDTRTDVYSLGVVLYELLVGTLPFDARTLLRGGLTEVQRIIKEVEPPKPSTRLSNLGEARGRRSGSGGSDRTGRAKVITTDSWGGHPVVEPDPPPEDRRSLEDIASRRRTEPKTLIQQIRGDLDWIVMKCLEKDRTRRYDTAHALALEIQRFLDHEPVLAGPPSAAYRVRKFVRRHRAAVFAASMFAMLLVLAIAGTSGGMFWALRERERAKKAEEVAWQSLDATKQARDEAKEVTLFLTDMLAAVDPQQQGKAVTVREVLDKSAETIGEKFAGRPLLEAQLRDTLARTYYGLGLYDKAEAHAAEAAALYRRLKGDRDPSTLTAMNTLAVAMAAQGNYDQSESQHRATLEIQRRVLGEEHPETLGSMNNLALALSGQGRDAEAEVLHRRAFEIQARVLGEENPETLRSLNGLANAIFSQGRYAQAEELFRKGLETRRRVLGEEHPETLRSVNGVANALYNEGRLAEATALNRKTLEVRRRVLGEEHPETLASMNNLGVCLSQQGNYAEAEELHRKALGSRRRLLGDEHPDTLQSMTNLSLALSNLGRYEEAEKLYRKALEPERRILGEEHPFTMASVQGLAQTLVYQGKPAEARPLVSELISVGRRAVDGKFVSPAALHDLAETLLTCEPEDLRDPAAALPLAEKAAQATGGTDPFFLDTLALAYHRTGALDRAVATQQKALSLLPDERTPTRALFEGRLGEYMTEQKSWAQAEPLLLSEHRALSASEHVPARDRKESLNRLVKLYTSWDAAEPGNGYDVKAAEYRQKIAELSPPPGDSGSSR